MTRCGHRPITVRRIGLYGTLAITRSLFWLKSGSVEHRAPRSEVSIQPDIAQALRQQLIAKGHCDLRHTVNFLQDDQLVAVAEHEIGLYADVPRLPGVRASLVQRNRFKTSALMIAGLRGDSVSRALAGDQGIAVARRMTRASPQLPALVAARDKHLRAYLSGDGKAHTQVLVLGAGWIPSQPNSRRHRNLGFCAISRTCCGSGRRDLLNAGAEIVTASAFRSICELRGGRGRLSMPDSIRPSLRLSYSRACQCTSLPTNCAGRSTPSAAYAGTQAAGSGSIT